MDVSDDNESSVVAISHTSLILLTWLHHNAVLGASMHRISSFLSYMAWQLPDEGGFIVTFDAFFLCSKNRERWFGGVNSWQTVKTTSKAWPLASAIDLGR